MGATLSFAIDRKALSRAAPGPRGAEVLVGLLRIAIRYGFSQQKWTESYINSGFARTEKDRPAQTFLGGLMDCNLSYVVPTRPAFPGPAAAPSAGGDGLRSCRLPDPP